MDKKSVLDVNLNNNIKVLQVNKFYYIKGGCESYFFSLTKLLMRMKYKIVPFSMKDKRNFNTDYDKYFIDNIDYNNMNIYIKIIGAIKIIFNFQARRKIKRLIKDTTPNIAHLHNYHHQISPSILRPIKKHMPIVCTVHDLKLICPSYKMINNNTICEKCKGNKYYYCVINKCVKDSRVFSIINVIEAYTHKILNSYSYVDCFIAPSKFFKDKLIEYGYCKDKIRYIPNFVDINEYVPHYQYEEYYIYFGRLSEEKGVNNLIEAAIKIKNYKVKIIGTGPMEETLKEKVRNNRADNISFEGFKSGDELKSMIMKAKFVVVPSICYENCPMTIIESMAFGKVVIGSKIGGIPELINNQELLFTYNDINEIKEKINNLINFKEEDVIRIGKSNREFIERKCSAEVHFSEISKVYDEVLNKDN